MFSTEYFILTYLYSLNRFIPFFTVFYLNLFETIAGALYDNNTFKTKKNNSPSSESYCIRMAYRFVEPPERIFVIYRRRFYRTDFLDRRRIVYNIMR
jgi:hypothetical protein